MLATLLRPDAGEARVLGHDIVREADAVRAAVSLTGQLASVDEDLTGRENLILIGRLLGLRRPARRRAATELLEAFGLAEAAGRLVKNYSGGMRRRLDIAASIVVTPQLMFLDEPTTGLDPRSRNQVWDIIRALRAGGTTILLCTQYLDEADQLADGIAVIDHGKVIAEGTPGQLKASVGGGALHVRLLDPEQRPEAERVLARELGEVHLEPDPAALSVSCADAERGAEAVARARAHRDRDRRLLARPAEPRRGLPGAHRPARRGRAGRGSRDRRRSGRMSVEPGVNATATLEDAALRKALASTARPPRASAVSAALTFGWRGMLKVKHVPEQLARRDDHAGDVRAHVHLPVRRRDRGLDRRVPRLHPARDPGHVGAVHDRLLGDRAQHRPHPKGVVDRFRSLPIWRPAPLVGALLGDSVRYLVAGTVIIVLGLILGFRPDEGVPGVVAALALVVVFAFGLSWVFTTLGLLLRSPNAVMNTGFMAIFPLTFLSQRVRRPGDAARRARGVRQRQPDLDPRRRLARADAGRRPGVRRADLARGRGAADRDLRAAHLAALSQPRLTQTS